MNTIKQVLQEVTEIALRHQELESSPAIEEIRKDPNGVLIMAYNHAIAGKHSCKYNVYRPGLALVEEQLKTLGLQYTDTTPDSAHVAVLEVTW